MGNTLGQFAEIRKNKELNALEEKKRKGLISEYQYEKEREKIEREAAKREKRIRNISNDYKRGSSYC